MADSTRLAPKRMKERSLEIGRCGYRVIRCWNGDVMENLGGVLETISRELDLSFSALGGGEGRGEMGGVQDGTAVPPLPLPLPLPLEGGEGWFAGDV
jgi:hypothetical protein